MRSFASLLVVIPLTLGFSSCGESMDGGMPGSETRAGAGTSFIISSENVSRETALAWPERFCQLRTGMTRSEVRRIMGPPTAEFLDGSLAQDNWNAYQFSITVFFEDRAQVTDPLRQKAYQLGADTTGSLSDEDKALFPCGAETVFD